MKFFIKYLLLSFLCLSITEAKGMKSTENSRGLTRASSVGVITEEQYANFIAKKREIQDLNQQILFTISKHMYDSTLSEKVSSIPYFEKALNARNNDGNTPLSYMLKKLNDDLKYGMAKQPKQAIENMKNLISLGANPNLVNEYSRSLADQTIIYFKDIDIKEDILSLLSQYGVLPSIVKAKTPDVKRVKIKQFDKKVTFSEIDL